MVYALKKFRHYLLGNRFTFYVDHMALMYLVNNHKFLAGWFDDFYYFWSMISRLYTNLVSPI